MQFRKFLFTISSLEWILHSLYQGCVFSKIWRELGFVHYIKYFTISRFTISRFECILESKVYLGSIIKNCNSIQIWGSGCFFSQKKIPSFYLHFSTASNKKLYKTNKIKKITFYTWWWYAKKNFELFLFLLHSFFFI